MEMSDMLTKRYLFDLGKWEVVLLAEQPINDKRIGLFNTVTEANKAIQRASEN
jgi:hypothetical protein